MELRYGDMLEQERGGDEVFVITTNGHVTETGRCVMGRGIARQVRDRFPGIDQQLGSLILQYGNRPFRLQPSVFWTLPVKHHWAQKADPELIEASLWLMGLMAHKFQPKVIHMPRPGCGNGQLSWYDIRPLVEEATADWPSEVHVWHFVREEDEEIT